ncbi:MAG: 1-(5-phosphoribosyl)-5-[(5-phosphoribosylamino)methylideneamino]imidazole-4-carboxamide isomerase [Flavobacteriaceae bacterium]|jgi:phosphoribosylformimino-5-aminoimidazole carboxamide ribotide isomerase|nr:1-(5-phosphoribosyl)-5-[(5-phosphoribosylamino)methylideneamino]imidazole-4-carboxamide isomerase [Flavobacteriaceae bacterium]
MRIIPAIDIINGRCVRLTKGDYNTEKIYREDPLDAAKEFEDAGLEYLHLVDLDGAKSSRIINHKTLYRIASQTHLKVDFGGGLKSDEDIRIAFENGAGQITGGSIAVKNPEIFQSWLQQYGSSKIILGADCNDRMIATHGWLESSSLDVIDFIKEYEKKGVEYVICTDISKDGMLEGTSNELYKEILEKNRVKLIASGGVSSVEDLYELEKIGCEGVIIGKAIYEGKISLKELSEIKI